MKFRFEQRLKFVGNTIITFYDNRLYHGIYEFKIWTKSHISISLDYKRLWQGIYAVQIWTECQVVFMKFRFEQSLTFVGIK